MDTTNIENADTKTITTTGGHKVVLKTFITGGEKRYIENAFLEDVEIMQSDGKQSFTVGGTRANIATDRALESVVMSVDGKTDGILKMIMGLHSDDSDEIMTAVDDITGEKKTEEQLKTQ